jgi:hypothetical protein
MTDQSILLPLFVQNGLTFFLIIWMAKERTVLLQHRKVDWQDIALRQTRWPDRAQQIGNCFENQFEIPILFYVLVVLAIITKKADLLFVVMEWVFVATRVAHAYVFTTSNYVPLRGQFFIWNHNLAFYVGDLRAPNFCWPLDGGVMRAGFP